MNNVLNLAWLIPLLPLLGFMINGAGRNWLSKKLSGFIGSAVIFISFVISVLVFFHIKEISGSVIASLPAYFHFIHTDVLSIPFQFKIDQLSSLFLLIITGVGFLIHVYSTSYMHQETAPHFAKYFSYLNLFVFSMLLLVMGSNFVIMFIGWEGVGLCSYLLIGYWYKNNDFSKAANKAFIMNRIGDFGFLLAVFWIIAKLGSVSYDEVFTAASLLKLSNTDVTGITLLLFLGATGKSAQLPLFTWLPDAMAGPTPVSALIHAATMVTAGIYMIARSNVWYAMAPYTMTVVAIVGLATALLAASIAIKQNDIKKVLAYSTVSQLGYMVLGLGVGAFTGAVFHVMTHAFFKALLFLGAGSVIHALGNEQDMRNMGGLKKKMPITHISFLIACLAIAGMPPFSGFFSKDEILAAAFSSHIVYWVLGVLGAVLTAFYMFRLYGMTFLGKFRGTAHQEEHLHESPMAITIPLLALAVLSVIGGWVGIPEVFAENSHLLGNFLAPVFADGMALLPKHHLSHQTEYILMGTSVILALAAIIYAVKKYKAYNAQEAQPKGFAKLLLHKWYVDECYAKLVTAPLNSFSKFLQNIIEKNTIDGMVNGVGKLALYGSRQIRWVQSGQVGAYILLMVWGMLILFIIKMFF